MKSPESKELKDIPGYWIHSDGRLWSEKTQKFLKDSRGGYKGKYRKYQFCLKNKKQKIKYVHRLLMEYFGPPAPEGCNEVNHIDGNTENNCLSNLEWVSSSENTRHGVRTGLFSRVLLTIEQVKEIKAKFKEEPNYHGKIADIAREYGVSHRVISSIKHEINWKYVEID
jgi:hypothetical protein